MLSITMLELVFRSIPEGLLYIIACYVLSNTKLDFKKIMLSGSILCIVIYTIRFLPIQFGIHTLLSIIATGFLSIKINNIKSLKAIQSSVLAFIIMFILELINMLIIKFVFKLNLQFVMDNPVRKLIYGIPSLVMFIAVLLLIKWRFSKK